MKPPRLSKRKIILLTGIFVLLTLCSVCAAYAQTSRAVVQVEPSIVSAKIDELFTVNITISNVQNLYGIDVTLNWNNAVLQVVNATHNLGVESNPAGVLHEATDAPIYIAAENASQEIGTYHLVATSQNPATSFSGSGTIATITFKVLSVGHSSLYLQSELADYTTTDEPAAFIEHTDVGGSVETVIPEFPTLIIVALFFVAVTMAVAYSKKNLNANNQGWKPSFL